MAFLSISHNFPEVERQLAQLEADVGRAALASALNRAVDQARVQMQRGIAREFKVTVAYVRERLKVKRAFAAGRLELKAELQASGGRKGRSANIIAFVEKSVTLSQARKRAADGTLRVLRVQVKRGQTKPLPGAFIGNKGRTVFRRTGRKRLPIEPVQTVDVEQMFNTRRINSAVLGFLQANLPRIFEREAGFYLSRFNRV